VGQSVSVENAALLGSPENKSASAIESTQREKKYGNNSYTHINCLLVEMETECTELPSVNASVAQGSVLGPLYVADLSDSLEPTTTTTIHCFTDTANQPSCNPRFVLKYGE
jgi:hypothetical protein